MTNIDSFKVIEDLYKEHYVYLKKILFSLTKSEELCDDIIQDVFAKILKNPSMILEVTYMKSWLVKAAKNTLLNYYKKKKPALLKEDHSIENLLINNVSAEDEMLLNKQLQSVLSNLSSLDKTILLAKVYYGYSYEEISDLLDIPVPTLKSKVFRLRKQLAKER